MTGFPYPKPPQAQARAMKTKSGAPAQTQRFSVDNTDVMAVKQLSQDAQIKYLAAVSWAQQRCHTRIQSAAQTLAEDLLKNRAELIRGDCYPDAYLARQENARRAFELERNRAYANYQTDVASTFTKLVADEPKSTRKEKT